MRYISRSSYDAFRRCMREGYWRYHSGPFPGAEVAGLEDTSKNWHMVLGQAWHLAAEGLLRKEPALEAVLPALELGKAQGLTEDHLNWLLAVTLAWEKAESEDFFQRWEVVSIEEELQTPLTKNVVLYTRADAILRDRADGTYWVLNWKTASDVKNWNRKWFFDIQSWTESLAAESKLGIPVQGCLYYGIWKGPIYEGKINSRLIYAYRYHSKGGDISYGTENNGGGARFSVAAERFPFGDGIPAWINWLSKDHLKRYFVESAPQIRQDSLVDAWLRQVVQHESDIDHILTSGSPEDKLDFFWQNWGEDCGRCSFKDLCMERSTPEELISGGMLQPRHKSPRDEAEEKANG